jgi:hypothetical protein
MYNRYNNRTPVFQSAVRNYTDSCYKVSELSSSAHFIQPVNSVVAVQFRILHTKGSKEQNTTESRDDNDYVQSGYNLEDFCSSANQYISFML